MIRSEQFDLVSKEHQHIQLEDVPAALAREQVFIWIDLEHPEPQDFEALFRVIPVAEATQEALAMRTDRSRFIWDARNLLFILHVIRFDEESLRIESDEIGMLLSKRYLVTMHHMPVSLPDELRQQWQRGNLTENPSLYLLYLLVDAIVDSYFPILDRIGDIINDMEEQTSMMRSGETVEKIFVLRRRLHEIHDTIRPMRDVINTFIRLEEGSPHFPGEKTRLYFGDVRDHLTRVNNVSDTYREMLASVMDAYQSYQSSQLNDVVNELTVATIVLTSAALITGFYGMNLRGLLINSRWPYGGYLMLGIIVVIMSIEFWIFIRKGWLRFGAGKHLPHHRR